jgi:hypothetical protein
MINTKLQSIIDTKSAIGNAIVNKGGTITGATPFFNYAAQIDDISTGTPQTIFAASDGSKWALTNVVNLTNVSNNVTYDFNRWQPANNGTSDPILNVGTVNGNISGNIAIVQVNQVNIAQYSNIVINDTTGAKYVGYNGYDEITNPTPTGNTTFNRWLLNNSASGTIIFANTTITNGGIYNGPNTTVNQVNLAFITNSIDYGGAIRSLTTNNGYIFAGGETNQSVQRYHESNLVRNSNTASYGGEISSVVTNNGFIYVGGETTNLVRKYNESTLAVVGNTASYGASITTVATNDGFIFVGGGSATDGKVQKFFESNLARSANSVLYGNGFIETLTVNNGFVFVGGYGPGFGAGNVSKYHESNLAFVDNTISYGGLILSVTTNNGFIYVGGFTANTVKKYYESNLAFVGNTVSYGGFIRSISANNGFLYVGGQTANTVKKYYEGNLAFVGNTAGYGGQIRSVVTNNGFIFAGGVTNQRVQKFQEAQITPDNQTFYIATKIKE